MKEDTKISNYYKFDSELLPSFTLSVYFSGLFPSLFASLVSKAFERKTSFLVKGVAVLAGSALDGGALNIFMLILGHVLLGIGVDFANQATVIDPADIEGLKSALDENNLALFFTESPTNAFVLLSDGVVMTSLQTGSFRPSSNERYRSKIEGKVLAGTLGVL